MKKHMIIWYKMVLKCTYQLPTMLNLGLIVRLRADSPCTNYSHYTGFLTPCPQSVGAVEPQNQYLMGLNILTQKISEILITCKFWGHCVED